MYAYIEGKLTRKNPTYVHLDVNGVGYLLQITLNTYAEIEELESGKLYTYLHVREDVMSLYGFSTESEKDMFGYLISVSGIGPNTARVVLSSMTTKEVNTAILQENVAAFNKVKGIGPKTAKRVILDLKDKMAKLDIGQVDLSAPNAGPSIKTEAISALVSLGFNKQQVSKKIEDILNKQPAIDQVEEIIKEVLKQMS